MVNDAAATISGTSFGILSQAAIINAINVTNSGKIEATGTALTAGIAIGTSGTATVNNLSGGTYRGEWPERHRHPGPGRHRHRQRGHDRGRHRCGNNRRRCDLSRRSRQHRRRHQFQRHSGEQHRDCTDGLLTVNNSVTGTITSGGAVLKSNGAVNVTNSGTIATTGVSSTAIEAGTDVTLNNSGIIQAIHRAITGGNVSIINTNTIVVNGVAGSSASAIQAGVLNLDNSQSIFVTGTDAVGAVEVFGNGTIKNSGTIVSDFDNTFAIKSDLARSTSTICPAV